jgi:IclR family acetate operon transcriptional repressor
MPDVLDRATRLLGALAAQPDVRWRLGDVATACALPPATCSRLLKRLVGLGWVTQDGNRGLYQIGPRAFALAHGQPYRAALIAAAQPWLARLAGDGGDGDGDGDGGAGLSVLVGWRRVFICGVRGDGRTLMPIDEATDIYPSPSGRVLLAGMTSREVHRAIDALGLPRTQAWSGIATRPALLAALRHIRRAGAAWSTSLPNDMAGVAVRVPDGNGGWAALGVWRSRTEWDPTLIDRVREAARHIRP